MSKLTSTLALAVTVAISSFARPASPSAAWPTSDGLPVERVGRTELDAPLVPRIEEETTRRIAEPRRGLEEAVHAFSRGSVLYLPVGFHAEPDGAFDLVVHFHGGAQIVEPGFVRAGLNAALVTVNLGIGSGVYQSAYDDPSRLEGTLAWVRAVVESSGHVRNAEVRRLALSAWSAGYGALMRILPQRHSVDVDAVLLADGLHAGYLDARRHTIDPLRMAPFTRFAEEAAAGEKLMAVTHSTIDTYGYASTTETAAYLLEHTGTSAEPDAGLDAPGLVRTSTADRGELHIRAFEGATKEAHCAHVRGLGQTLFPMLAKFWRR